MSHILTVLAALWHWYERTSVATLPSTLAISWGALVQVKIDLDQHSYRSGLAVGSVCG